MQAAVDAGELTFDNDGNAHLHGASKVRVTNEPPPDIRSPARVAEEGIQRAEETDKIPYIKPASRPATPSASSNSEQHIEHIENDEESDDDDDDDNGEEEEDEPVTNKSNVNARPDLLPPSGGGSHAAPAPVSIIEVM